MNTVDISERSSETTMKWFCVYGKNLRLKSMRENANGYDHGATEETTFDFSVVNLNQNLWYLFERIGHSKMATPFLIKSNKH